MRINNITMANPPTHYVYYAKDLEGTDKAKWMKIETARPHQDGKGFSVELELMPVQGGGINLREVTEKETLTG